MRRITATVAVTCLAALAAACGERVILTTQDAYWLASGQTVRGDLEVGTSLVTLEEGSLVTGSVTVPAGDLVAGGEVRGDVNVPAGDVTLGPRAVVRGGLIGGSGLVRLEEGSLVTGSVTLPAGNLVAEGEIRGDVIAPAGDVTLGPRAVVRGDVQLGAGALERAEGAVVEGRVIQTESPP